MNRILLLITASFLFGIAHGQLLFNNGATIYSMENAIIKVEGGTTNNEGIIEHNGVIEIDDYYSTELAATTQGNGEYRVFGDWINNGTFINGNSHVRLNGTNQLITGNNVTRYWDLSIENSGIKTMTINSEVEDSLNLNNLELATNLDTMTILNTDPGCVSYDNTFGAEGFVSSNYFGSFVRNTNQNQVYIFPTGRNTSGLLFRAVEITPETTSANSFGVALVEEDATNDNLDRDLKETIICEINPYFYHRISQTQGTDNASVGITYVTSLDGEYNGIANWDTTSTNQWYDAQANLSGGANGYDAWFISPNSDYNTENFALSFSSTELTTANWDSLTLESGLSEIVDASLNDAGNISSITIIEEPINGTALDQGNGEFEYTSDEGFVGTDSLTYTICADDCPTACDTAKVYFYVNEETPIHVPNGFTPNADGFNDTFIVTGISRYPDNEVTIFNRWGDVIYSAAPYENDWNGQTNPNGLNLNNGNVVEGTYFYVITLSTEMEAIKGYVELIKND